MAKDYSQEIQILSDSFYLFSKTIGSSKDTINLSESDLEALGKAYPIYKKLCEPYLGYRFNPLIVDVYSFQEYVTSNEIEKLINILKELSNPEEVQQKEQEASIPPELESMVAEYRQNQIILEEEEIKSNSQRSVAEQVKIAIAHSKIKELALANRQKRIAQGEKFQNQDNVLINLGSPKSETEKAALAASYNAVKQIALTYSGFTKLSPQLQNEIISSAVELKFIGIIDTDTAIQASALQVDLSKIDENDKKNLATIPGGFVSSVYHEVVDLDKQRAEYESKITENEENVLTLQKQGKISEAKALVEENANLIASLDGQSARFLDKVTKQRDSFKDFEDSRKRRLSQNPLLDLNEKEDNSNEEIRKLNLNLEKNGVKGHLYTPIDDAQRLEEAIQHDMGGLNQFPSYKGQVIAGSLDSPLTQSQILSPFAVRFFSQGGTPELLAQARKFAKENPESALGKLFKTRKDIFDSVGSQLRKIANSPLGKEILPKIPTTSIDKTFKSISGVLGKISNRAGQFGKILGAISNPWGAFKSWAGQMVGKYIKNKIVNSAAGKAAIAAVRKLAQELLNKGTKALADLAVKVGAKFGVELSVSATGVGIPVALIMVAVDVVISIAKIGINIIQKTAESIYGEKIKPKDILAVPLIGAGTITGGFVATAGAVVGFFGTLATSTVSAASSAVGIIATGIIIGAFFYITSIATAPLISTLVQLDSTTRSATSSGTCSQAIADRAKQIAENLQLGFGHYYNKSPDYPQYWNAALFAQNPNTPEAQIGAQDMFWCNYLPLESFLDNKETIPFFLPTMVSYFQGENKWTDGDDATYDSVCPGDAIYFNIPSGTTTIAHTGVVYDVSPDGIHTYESNAPYITMFYPTDSTGHFQIIGSGSYSIHIAGFGAP